MPATIWRGSPESTSSRSSLSAPSTRSATSTFAVLSSTLAKSSIFIRLSLVSSFFSSLTFFSFFFGCLAGWAVFCFLVSIRGKSAGSSLRLVPGLSAPQAVSSSSCFRASSPSPPSDSYSFAVASGRKGCRYKERNRSASSAE